MLAAVCPCPTLLACCVPSHASGSLTIGCFIFSLTRCTVTPFGHFIVVVTPSSTTGCCGQANLQIWSTSRRHQGAKLMALVVHTHIPAEPRQNRPPKCSLSAESCCWIVSKVSVLLFCCQKQARQLLDQSSKATLGGTRQEPLVLKAVPTAPQLDISFHPWFVTCWCRARSRVVAGIWGGRSKGYLPLAQSRGTPRFFALPCRSSLC